MGAKAPTSLSDRIFAATVLAGCLIVSFAMALFCSGAGSLFPDAVQCVEIPGRLGRVYVPRSILRLAVETFLAGVVIASAALIALRAHRWLQRERR